MTAMVSFSVMYSTKHSQHFKEQEQMQSHTVQLVLSMISTGAAPRQVKSRCRRLTTMREGSGPSAGRGSLFK